jgi:hypothetical protein
MSTLNGIAPVVNVTESSVLANSDDSTYLRMLLNNYNSFERNVTSPLDLSLGAEGFGENFNMITSSNKSLLVTDSQANGPCPAKVDAFSVVCNDSNLLFTEEFRYKITPSNCGEYEIKVNVPVPEQGQAAEESGMLLKEVCSNPPENTPLATLQAQDKYRALGGTSIKTLLGAKSLGLSDHYGKTDVTKGVEEATAVTGDKLSVQNMSLTFDKTEEDASKYAYGTVRVSHGDSMVDVNNNNSSGNIVKSDGSSISSESLKLSSYEGSNYDGGNYSANYSDLTSSVLTVEVTNADGEDAAFSRKSKKNSVENSDVKLDATFSQVNLSVLGDGYPRSNLVLALHQDISKNPTLNSDESVGVLERVTDGVPEVLRDKTKLTTTTDVTINSRLSNTRMSVTDENSIVTDKRVYYSDGEKSVSSDTLLSDSNKNVDVTYDLDLLLKSSASQYKVLEDGVLPDISSTLLLGPHPVSNLIFSVSEVLSVESASDVEVLDASGNRQDAFLVNLSDVSKHLDLDGDAKTESGADLDPSSFISTSLLRNGAANANENNLRVHFVPRMSDALYKAKRDSSVNSGSVDGDAVTNVSIVSSGLVSSSSSALFEYVRDEPAQPMRWDLDYANNVMSSLAQFNSNAAAYKAVYCPKFHQGGINTLKVAIASSTYVDAGGNKVYVPQKVQYKLQESIDGVNFSDVSELQDIPKEKVNFEVLSSSVSNGVRKVKVQISHPAEVPSIVSSDFSVKSVMEYCYNEQTFKWATVNNAVPSPSVCLKLAPAYLFPHKAQLEGLDADEASWDMLDGHLPNYVSLALSYNSENPLEFKDNTGEGIDFCVKLLLYNNYEPDVPEFLNNNYSLPLKTLPGGWSAKYKEINLSNSPQLDAVSIKDELASNATELTVIPSRTSTNTTLTVKDGENSLFKCVIPNNKLRNFVGYRISDSLVKFSKSVDNEASSDLFTMIVPNNTRVKIEDGVYVTLGNVNSLSSTGVFASLSLLNDLYSVSYPAISQTSVPNDRVLVSARESHKQISSLKRRGSPDGVYVFSRPQNKYKATWGSLSESGNLPTTSENVVEEASVIPNPAYDPDERYPPGMEPPQTINANKLLYKYTLNFDKSTDIKLCTIQPEQTSLANAELDANKFVFSQNYSTVSVKLVKSSNNSVLANGSHMTDRDPNPFGFDEVAPWVDKYKLNNFFCKVQKVTITLTQPDITVAHSGTYAWAAEVSLNTFVGESSVTFTENELITSNTKDCAVPVGKVNFQFTYVPKLRRDAKTMYACILPEVLELALLEDVSVKQYHKLLNRTSLNLKLGGSSSDTHILSFSGVNASNVQHLLKSNLLAQALHENSVVKTPLKLSLQGRLVADPVVNGLTQGVWFDYSIGEQKEWDLTLSSNTFTFEQQQTIFSDRDILKFTWDMNLASRFAGDGYSSILRVSPSQTSTVVQYSLGFELSSSGVLNATVTKLSSAQFNPDLLLHNRTLLSGLALISLPVAARQRAVLSVSSSDIGLPHDALLAGVNYPSENSLLPSGTFVTLDDETIKKLDLLIQVNKSNQNGVTKYLDLFGRRVSGSNGLGKRKAISIFCKDQMVVKNHMGRVCMRIGPDGRLYTGDLSTYSLYVQDPSTVLEEKANGLMGLALNSQSSLNNIVQISSSA